MATRSSKKARQKSHAPASHKTAGATKPQPPTKQQIRSHRRAARHNTPGRPDGLMRPTVYVAIIVFMSVHRHVHTHARRK